MIRKFLDAQRIHNLTAYLQALHRQSLANADHTTLLLNCYTKLKDSSKLEEFIKVRLAPKWRNAPDFWEQTFFPFNCNEAACFLVMEK